ncbi:MULTISPECIES: hypothetical protein [unclassified Shewanella]|uniref:hypothetical protein n=2 Tax=Shewanella TaxID=22 RepID=UPI000C834142|nr:MULTISPECIES: hypothetical protein [unclassified Shewanella]MDO6618244.1 hypothetical protein [Shewanella sp. 6_MG-2023]MDO6638520.1 hypothetical protein [Shewanella sp. 5_MG-2023]MDO6777530.1 hypothetical protein [Shewanella sp. 3_MG-2023]PMG29888.1 hypothetical protein BCU94_12470 [Shewanella sp. 10N.286.52.C2]PMH87862.1 hypothetical protein BCU57_00895 [Shewanella sp. 10N.286.48.B5]
MKLAAAIKHFWSFGIISGLIVSVLVTLFIVIWEWLENPGGIFHGAEGTNWQFVYDTGISWFMPTFIYVAIIAAVSHLIYSAIKWLSDSADNSK